MLIGVPKEIKNHEYRVGLIPAAVKELILRGHRVLVEASAGAGIGHPDVEYEHAGATIAATAVEVFKRAELIVKVKEPQASERALLRSGQTLFTYLHLAPDQPQTLDLMASGATCIAYETVTDREGHLPLLAPMSEVAGRMSIQAGARCLEKSSGGSGILLGGTAGVVQANVLILGGGVVGSNAAQMAVGLGARVTIIDRSLDVLRIHDRHFGNRVQTLYGTQATIEREARQADLIIGGVLIPGASAPRLLSAEFLKEMRPGSALVDVSIDQGGCFETSHATTHDDPTFVIDDIVHYCVANMPGAVARTSATALNNATLPFVLAIADRGTMAALVEDANLENGLNIHEGKITNQAVAEAHGLEYHPFCP